jgi:hypothetical protein
MCVGRATYRSDSTIPRLIRNSRLGNIILETGIDETDLFGEEYQLPAQRRERDGRTGRRLHSRRNTSTDWVAAPGTLMTLGEGDEREVETGGGCGHGL